MYQVYIMQIVHASRTEAPEYTVDIIAQILQHIEQKQRLSNCALVSRTWRQAANLATTKVSCKLVTSEAYSSLSAWLSSNSNTTPLETIAVCSNRYQYRNSAAQIPILRLPVKNLSKLHDLKLVLCNLQAADEGAVPAAGMSITTEAVSASCTAFTALTALTRLQPDLCDLNISLLGSCTSLRHLSLKNYRHATAIAVSSKATAAAAATTAEGSLNDMLAAALSQLQQLTHLTLGPGYNHDLTLDSHAACQHFGDLHQLLELRLRHISMAPNSSLTLPSSLTMLELHAISQLTVNTAPALQQLSHLQHLEVSSVDQFDPVLLQNLSKLQFLQLFETPLDSTESQELMSALGQLQQLQHLELNGSLMDVLEAVQSYAALTASSQLTFLNLDGSVIAPAAAAYIFAADRPCKGLLTINAGAELFRGPGSFQRLAGCCPALRDLVLMTTIGEQRGIDLQGLTALKALTTLTSLELANAPLNDEALAIIASFSHLKDLTLQTVAEGGFEHLVVTTAGAMQLTQLTALTRLELNPFADTAGSCAEFNSTSPKGSPHDVYMQLWDHLALDVPVAEA